MQQNPNILYIHSHDSGRYVQPYGYSVKTPNIQELAEDGVLFRKAFSGAPQCCPSRAALLTGQAAHSCGQFGLVNRGFELRDRHKHIANFLKELFYSTQLIGVQHEVWDPITCGYMDWINPIDWKKPKPIEEMDHDTALNAAKFLLDSPSKPFFLSVGFASTHRDFSTKNILDDPRYCAPPLPLPDTPEIRLDFASYKTSARKLDSYIGTVLDALKKSELYENTIIICTTDHGIAFPKMKCNLTDHGIGVMLIMRGPQDLKGGKVIDAIISHIDIFPTICDLIGVDHPNWLQGQSLIPVVGGNVGEINEAIFAEQSFHAAYEPMRTVRTKRWKYIKRFYDFNRPMLSNIDNSQSKDFLIENGFAQKEIVQEELYDLVDDPSEANNNINDPRLKDICKSMREKLMNWMLETNDPLLDGPIPIPQNSFVCDKNDFSPYDIWDRVEKPDGYA